MGLPEVLTSDQGSEFNNSLDIMLMEMIGIDHELTTPYHNIILGQWLSVEVDTANHLEKVVNNSTDILWDMTNHNLI